MVHYENVKTDVLGEMRKILNFFNMPINDERLKCLFKHKDGLFHREPTKTPEVVPFNPEIRKGIYVSFALIPQRKKIVHIPEKNLKMYYWGNQEGNHATFHPFHAEISSSGISYYFQLLKLVDLEFPTIFSLWK